MHELVPKTPLRHGHAISIDMAYSATLANSRKLISDTEHRRILTLFSRAGLSMDHYQFNEEILSKATAAILKTRDGKLRAAVPNPIGSCTFLNDIDTKELNAALLRHKKIMKEYPRNGEGIEAFVDASDTGYTENNQKEVETVERAATMAGSLNGNGIVHGGVVQNVIVNGTDDIKKKLVNGIALTNGIANGTNGFTNGTDGIKKKLVNGNNLSNGITNGKNGFTNVVRS